MYRSSIRRGRKNDSETIKTNFKTARKTEDQQMNPMMQLNPVFKNIHQADRDLDSVMACMAILKRTSRQYNETVFEPTSSTTKNQRFS